MEDNGKNQGKITVNKKTWTTHEVKEVIYSTLKMVVEDSHYYYKSSVDPSYSKLTKSGEEFVLKVFDEFLPLLQVAEQEALEKRARDLTLTILSDKETKQ